MQRVFISSVMQGFDAERAAVRSAVESLGLKPVMAETFGAKPFSSKLACLDGVRNSDIYVGILGARHGFVTQSGLCVTEEEFQEAKKRGVPVLFFVQKVDREPGQQQFIERIRGYEEGYFLSFFNDPEELRSQVTGALHNLIAQPEISPLDAPSAKARIQALMPSGRDDHEVMVGGVLIPVRPDEHFPPLEMGKEEVRDNLKKLILFGSGAIFSTELGTLIKDQRESLRFEQQNEHRQVIRCVEFYSDGTMFGLSKLIGERSRNGFSLVRLHVIDQDAVQRWITSFLACANQFYQGLEASPFLSAFYLAVFLKNLEHKQVGHVPQQEPSSMSLPMNSFPDPLIVPAEPRRIARAEFSDAPALSSKLIGLLERAFRAEGCYYGSK